MKMTSDKYWRSLDSDEKQVLADELSITKVYLSNVMNMQKNIKPSIELAQRIETQTCGAVSRKALRPDVNFKVVEEE